MERLNENQETRGFSAAVLQTWGYLFLLLGIAAAFIQNHLLGLSGMTGQQVLDLMNQSGATMSLVTTSLILQALESCAVPIFALLTVESFAKATDWKRQIGSVTLVALVSEIPYNLAMSGKVLDFSTRNPAFGLVIALVMLWFYRYYDEKGGNATLMKVVLTVAAVLWGGMLSIHHGTFLVLMVAVLWLIRNKPYKILIGALAAAFGCLISIYYVVSPISFLAVHFYNGEEGQQNKIFSMICYPLLLLAGFAAAILI